MSQDTRGGRNRPPRAFGERAGPWALERGDFACEALQEHGHVMHDVTILGDSAVMSVGATKSMAMSSLRAYAAMIQPALRGVQAAQRGLMYDR